MFCNLRRNPFDITPDPSFLCPTKRHNEALAALYYGMQWHKGFVVVTGQAGTGKTLLTRCLLQLLKQKKDVAYTFVFNSQLSPREFLQYIATDFGIATPGMDKGEILFELRKFVVTRGQKNLSTVVIVDEAHHLSLEALEEIRLLTNLETAERKLLQIILLGQPELDDKLDSVKLAQLKQRISIRSRLEPLDGGETKTYIERRLQLAGANSHAAKMFPEATIASVYRHSKGIPRLINTICENALVAAYAQQLQTVTPAMVEGVAEDLRLDVVRPPDDDESTAVDVHKAAKILLDLYANLQKTPARDATSHLQVAARVR